MKYIFYKCLQEYVHAGYKRQKAILLREYKASSYSRLPDKIPRVLELACGGGNFAAFFPRENYIGIDFLSDRIASARKQNPGYHFKVYDVTGIDSKKLIIDSDFIFCHGLLHHLNDDECAVLIQNIQQFSKKPAIFIAIEPI